MKISVTGMLTGNSMVATEDGPVENQRCQITNLNSGLSSCHCKPNSKVFCYNYWVNRSIGIAYKFVKTDFSFDFTVKTPSAYCPFGALKLAHRLEFGYGMWVNIIVQTQRYNSSEDINHEILPILPQSRYQSLTPKIMGTNMFFLVQLDSLDTFEGTVCEPFILSTTEYLS